jgi:hypothetical protein
MVADGWLTKLDTGLKWGDSRAMMLRCEVARIVRGAELAMAEKGRPIFRALMPDGELRDVAVR